MRPLFQIRARSRLARLVCVGLVSLARVKLVVVSGAVAAFCKYMVQETKVAELRDTAFGRLFWRFSDAAAAVITNSVLLPPSAQAAKVR